MKQIAPSALDRIAPATTTANEPRTLENKGLSEGGEALKGFDNYLNKQLDQGKSSDHSADQQSKNHLENVVANGKESPKGGNISPPEDVDHLSYLTAADDLVSQLQGQNTSSDELSSQSTLGTSLFDSAIYQDLVNQQTALNNLDSEIAQSAKYGADALSFGYQASMASAMERGLGQNLNSQLSPFELSKNQSLNSSINNLGLAAGQQTFDAMDAPENFLELERFFALSQKPQNLNLASMPFGQAMGSLSIEGDPAMAQTDEPAELSSLKETSQLLSGLATKGTASPSTDVAALKMRIDTPVNQDAWGEQFVLKMKNMVISGEQKASLHIHPSELGAVEISMSTEGDKAKVQFIVQTNGARDAIENSLSRLREVFEQSGMQLAESGVEQHDGGQFQGHDGDQNNQGLSQFSNQESISTSLDEDSESDLVARGSVDNSNVIDYYI